MPKILIINIEFVIELTTTNQLKQRKTLRASLIYSNYTKDAPVCGHFPTFDQFYLNIFLGAKGNTGFYYNSSLGERSLQNSEMSRQINIDATSVHVGNYFWVFGGTQNCGNCPSIA